jgi:hypothetical protein
LEESAVSIASLKMEVKGKVVQPCIMKAYAGGVEVQLLSFITKALNGYKLPENWCSMFWIYGSLTIKVVVYFGIIVIQL